jgi:hypothetical protein
MLSLHVCKHMQVMHNEKSLLIKAALFSEFGHSVKDDCNLYQPYLYHILTAP